MLKKSIYYIAILTIVFCFSIAVQAQQTFIANLSGAQEIPPVQTSARAVCTLKFNQSQTQGELVCQYANLFGSPSENVTVNIHGNAGVGDIAPVVLSLQVPLINSNGEFTRSFVISPNQIAEIHANRNYLTMRLSSILIRGQIHLANGTYNDFDGDGRTDLTVYRNSNRSFYAQSSLTGELIAQAIGQGGDSVSLTADFDNDGKSDFSSAGYNTQIVWRILKSATQTLQEIVWGSSASGDLFAAADYDGDGAFDLAVFRAGVWYIIESSTGTYRYEYFGGSGDAPTPNDYDRDGRADLAVARRETNSRVWYVRRSSDNQSYVVQWGLSGDAFFTGRADWDGDGAADITVVRNQSGQRTFYILQSSNSQLQVIRWGASSDLVKLGDYDGDGKTDAAVTRTVDGLKVFFILQSSTGKPRYEYFGLSGDF